MVVAVRRLEPSVHPPAHALAAANPPHGNATQESSDRASSASKSRHDKVSSAAFHLRYAAGRLRAVRIGRGVRVAREALEELLGGSGESLGRKCEGKCSE